MCSLTCGLISCRRHRTPRKITFVSSTSSRQHWKTIDSHEHKRNNYTATLSLINIVNSSPNGDIKLQHTGYVISYNPSKSTPSWVAWELTSDETSGPISRTDYDFTPDPMLDACNQVEKYEYANSGYDRGHMCPAGDMEWSSSAMKECHYMTNICPQAPKLNQIYWERLESACRRWANYYGAIYIICGPVYNKGVDNTIGTKHVIAVPDGFFKVVITLAEGEEKGIGFYYTNNDARQTMQSAAMTIDTVEELTGYDFFSALPDDIENAVEASSDIKIW